MTDSLPRALPTEMGVDPKALLKLLDAIAERRIALHGLTILRHGAVIAEGWWKPYSSALMHMLFSLSKSFTSTAVGFAAQEGLLRLDDRLVDFFPEQFNGRPCGNMEKLTLRDMLRMSTGHVFENGMNENIFLQSLQALSSDWRHGFLTSYLEEEPGTRFFYNTASTYMLSAVIQKVSGLQTGEYLRYRLFEPLGISEWWWESCPQGIHTGGFGLNLRTGDIAKFGQFLLQKGMWNGKQLLNAEWIDEATSFQIQNSGEKDWGMGYGYQFWRCVPQDAYRGDGAFGQLCVVLPRQDMVIAVNAGLGDMQEEMDVFWENLLPGVSEAPLPANEEVQSELSKRLSSLQIAFPEGTASYAAEQVSGAVYELSDNAHGFERVSLSFGGETILTLWKGGRVFTFPIGHGEWLTCETNLPRNEFRSHDAVLFDQVSCAGAWKDGVYSITLVYCTTPFADEFSFSFDGNALSFTTRRNVGFTPVEPVRIIGRRIS